MKYRQDLKWYRFSIPDIGYKYSWCTKHQAELMQSEHLPNGTIVQEITQAEIEKIGPDSPWSDYLDPLEYSINYE